MIVVLRHYAGPMADRSYEQHTAEGRIYDTIEQTLTAIPVVKAFGGEDERRARQKSVALGLCGRLRHFRGKRRLSSSRFRS